MYSDTHFHFKNFAEKSCTGGSKIFEQMAQYNCFFGMDIGTEADDLIARQKFAEKSISSINDSSVKEKIQNFLYFSAGIWPSQSEISRKYERIELLKKTIENAENLEGTLLHKKIIAVGECGLDRYHNKVNDCRLEVEKKLYEGECSLFEMQLELAKEYGLPVIIHSRQAFEDTLNCIKNINYDKGIIHCFSYGQKEAQAFFERGWYISLSGTVTYNKKSQLEEIKALVNCIPEELILCETDSPYLAPVPFRGKVNTPLLIEHTYKYIASLRNITAESLCNTVDRNIKKLFNLTI